MTMRLRQLLLFLALAAPALAVDTLDVVASDPILQPGNWTRFDKGSGVAGRIRGVHAEPEGRLWLATEHGLQYYDGLRFTTWTEADGLPSDDMASLAFDDEGTLWASFREAGVARRDGDRWVTYGLEDGLVRLQGGDLHVTRSGDLWLDYRQDELGTPAHAISRFDDGLWTTLALPDPERPVGVITVYEAADGGLWLTTTVGVLRYEGGSWTWFTEEDGAPVGFTVGVVETENGDLWFAGLSEGVFRFDGRAWFHYGKEQGIDPTRRPAVFWRGADGRLWLGGIDLIAWLDGDRWRAYDKEDYPGNSYASCFPIPGSRAWWVFDWFTDRFYHFDPERSAQSFTLSEGLSGGLEGPDGSVWFHTGGSDATISTSPSPGRLAVRYHEGQWLGYGGDDGLFDGAVYNVSKTEDGDVWYIGLDGGETAVGRLSEDGWHFYRDGLLDPTSPIVDGLVAHPTLRQTDDGRIWLLGGHGGGPAISRFDGQAWTREVIADEDLCEWAMDIYRTSDGDLWVSCWYTSRPDPNRDGALLRFDGDSWRPYTTLDGLPSTYITGLAEYPRGTLQVGTIRGLSSIDIGSKEAVWRNKADFDVANPKPRVMLPTDEGLWFAFMVNRRAGVVRYDGQTHHRITMDEGLVSDEVNDIQRLTDGALWFLTRGGVSRYDGQRWVSYGQDRGLLSGNGPVMHEMSDQTLWIDSGDGTVTRFRPPLGSGAPETELLEAAAEVPSHGNLKVSWSGIDAGNVTASRELQYQYRLDGGDWSASTRSSELTLTSLKHGEHELEVRTLDDDGNLDAAPALHAFTVAAPWWLNGWVIGATALFVGLIAVQSGRVVRRGRALQAANERLLETNTQLEDANRVIQLADQRKSQFLASMSHELRTPMNAIIGFTRVVVRRGSDQLSDRHRDNLVKVEGSAEHLLVLINDLLDLSKIEAGRMEAEEKTFDVRQLVEACCASVDPLVKAGVALRSEIADGVGSVHSDEGKVRQIVVNLLSNALKFTDQGSVTVRVSRSDIGELQIAVADTGVGIPEQELDDIFEEFHQVMSAEREDRGTGLGLAITRRFVELLGGSIVVESRVGEGSTFTVRLPAG